MQREELHGAKGEGPEQIADPHEHFYLFFQVNPVHVQCFDGYKMVKIAMLIEQRCWQVLIRVVKKLQVLLSFGLAPNIME